MTSERSDYRDRARLYRRDVLKASAVGMGALAFGIPAFSRTVRAADPGHPSGEFYMYGIDHFSRPNKLVKIDSADLIPDAGTITVESIDLSSNVNVNTLAAHPFEEDGVRYFYSTDLYTNKAFKVSPTDGTVTHFGSSNSILGGIAGSAMLVDDDENPHWFGITHGGASPASTLFEIDLSDGSTTEKGGLHTVGEDGSTPVTATHLGMGVNFLTNELWGVIGNPADPAYSQVFRVVDTETGEVEIVDAEAMTGGRSVGAALGPCANIMYAVRTGNSLYGYDVAADEEYTYGTLEYNTGSLDFDSLAVPYGYECEGPQYCEVDLVAAQTIGVGTVGFLLEDETLSIRYETDEGYFLDEVHAHVVGDVADFPGHGKKSFNPAPGQFDHQETFGPGVNEFEFPVDVSGLDVDDEYLIAAHAVVYRPDCETEWLLEGLTGEDETLSASFDHPIFANGEMTVTNPNEDVTVALTRDGTTFDLGTVDEGSTGVFDLSNLDIDLDDDGDDDIAFFDATVSITGDVDDTPITIDSLEVDCLVDWEETAWAKGCLFNDGNTGKWGWYVRFDGEDCGCLESEPAGETTAERVGTMESDEGDGDRGHGNELDGYDEDNPGKSSGSHRGGNGRGTANAHGRAK